MFRVCTITVSLYPSASFYQTILHCKSSPYAEDLLLSQDAIFTAISYIATRNHGGSLRQYI